MKLHQFQLSLSKVEVVLAEAQGKQSAEILSMFTAALSKVDEETTVAQWVRLAKKQRTSNSASTYPSELKRIFSSLEDLYRTTGPVRFANDLKKTLELFKGAPGQSVKDFINDITLTKKPPKTKNRKRTNKSAEELKDIARQLSASMSDQNKFDKLLHILAQSDNYSIDDVSAITSHIMGFPASYPTREAALEAIKNKRLMNSLNSSQLFSGSRLV